MRKPTLILASLVGMAAMLAAAGVHRAGCVGPNGAVGVRKPTPVTTCRVVNGVRVCKQRW